MKIRFLVEGHYMICDITTSWKPILLQYTIYTSVIWELEASSAHTEDGLHSSSYSPFEMKYICVYFLMREKESMPF